LARNRLTERFRGTSPKRGKSESAGASPKRVPRWAQPLQPPEVPDGWHTGPPDFVGVGAQRAGTTWWYRGLEAHDRVVRPAGRRKELHFFNRFWRGEVPDDLAERYASLFPRPEGSITGEWTPRYMHDFWSLRLLKRAAPEARILVMLRDPVERWRSGTARAVRLSDAVWRGFYYEQLRRLFDLFPREQVLVQQFERAIDEPLAEMRRTCEFLGIEPFTELPRAMERKREPKRKRPLPEEMREELVALLSDDVRRTADLVADIDLARWPNFAHLS
jgi:hypothetical protein